MSRLLKNWPVIVLLCLSFHFQAGCGGGGGSSSSGVSSGGGTGTGGGTASLVISSTSMPAGIAGTPYSFTFGASGGTPPYTWGVTPGYANVSGSTLSSAGVFSGTLQ